MQSLWWYQQSQFVVICRFQCSLERNSSACTMVDRFGDFRSFKRENDLSPEQLLTIEERYMRRATSIFGNTNSTQSAFISEYCPAAPYVWLSLSAAAIRQYCWKCVYSETNSSATIGHPCTLKQAHGTEHWSIHSWDYPCLGQLENQSDRESLYKPFLDVQVQF